MPLHHHDPIDGHVLDWHLFWHHQVDTPLLTHAERARGHRGLHHLMRADSARGVSQLAVELHLDDPQAELVPVHYYAPAYRGQGFVG